MAQLTVKELIEELKKFPEEALVNAEGCDCINEVSSVAWQEYAGVKLKFVLIEID